MSNGNDVNGGDQGVQEAGEAVTVVEDLTMESMYGEALDQKQAAEAEATLLDPAGTYTAPLDGSKMDVTVYTTDDGRKGLQVSGQGVAYITDPVTGHDSEVKGRVFVRLSSQYRPDKNNLKRPDFAYQMYLAARASFKVVIGAGGAAGAAAGGWGGFHSEPPHPIGERSHRAVLLLASASLPASLGLAQITSPSVHTTRPLEN